MAKDQNTFAKRARETEKKRKAEAKRARRRERKSTAGQLDPIAEADSAAVDAENAAP